MNKVIRELLDKHSQVLAEYAAPKSLAEDCKLSLQLRSLEQAIVAELHEIYEEDYV